MKLTKERKRLVFLIGALVVLGGYSFYSNVLSGPSSPAPARRLRPLLHTPSPSPPPAARPHRAAPARSSGLP